MKRKTEPASKRETYLAMASTGRRSILSMTTGELQLLIHELGKPPVQEKGLALLEKGRAFVYLPQAPNICLSVKTKGRLTKEQLQGLGFTGRAYGLEVKDKPFRVWFWEEVKLYWLVAVAILLLLPFLIAASLSSESFVLLNQATLSVVAIFVAVHLAFMSLFYSSTRNRPHTYLDQTFSDQTTNDRNVVIVAILSIWISILSLLLSAAKPSLQPVTGELLSLMRASCSLPWCSRLLSKSTVLAVLLSANFFLVHISLVAITDYYLTRSRDERLMTAYLALHRQHFPSTSSTKDDEV